MVSVIATWTEPDWRDRTPPIYPEKHADGTWWVHYRDDDGTAPPEPMKLFVPSVKAWEPSWQWSNETTLISIAKE
jgi:hypothetical protein